jgi:hypothetical protein
MNKYVELRRVIADKDDKIEELIAENVRLTALLAAQHRDAQGLAELLVKREAEIGRPSAYLNALREEGSRDELLHQIGLLYDENEQLRRDLTAQIKVTVRNGAEVERLRANNAKLREALKALIKFESNGSQRSAWEQARCALEDQ